MIRIYNWKIDIDSRVKSIVDETVFKVGDTNTNKIKLSVFNKGEPLDLNDKSVVFVFLKSNGKKVEHSNIDLIKPLIVNGNEVECLVRDNVMNNQGQVIVEITIMNGDKLLTSRKVFARVDSKIDWMVEHENDNQIPILQGLIAEVESQKLELEKLKLEGFNLTFQTWDELVNGKGNN